MIGHNQMIAFTVLLIFRSLLNRTFGKENSSCDYLDYIYGFDALFMTLLIQVCHFIWMMYDGTVSIRC